MPRSLLVQDTAFSPTDAALLAVGLINGITRLYNATGLVATKLRSARSHAESCRAVCFASDGQTLLSASADATILACNVESGTPLARIRHSKAVDRLASVSATQFAAADESGLIQLWDTRQEEAACAVQMHRDYVTALVAEPEARRLLSTSGDGNLGVLDLRTHKVRVQDVLLWLHGWRCSLEQGVFTPPFNSGSNIA